MAKIRVDSELKEELKQFLENSNKWNKQSEFANHAIREKLDEEKMKNFDLTQKEVKLLKELAKEKSEQ